MRNKKKVDEVAERAIMDQGTDSAIGTRNAECGMRNSKETIAQRGARKATARAEIERDNREEIKKLRLDVNENTRQIKRLWASAGYNYK